MKKMFACIAAGLLFTASVAFSAEPITCQASAQEKQLKGAAKASHLKKCEKDAKAACEARSAEKSLKGAAKASFEKKCLKDAVGETPSS
jgi:hypothetical protein